MSIWGSSNSSSASRATDPQSSTVSDLNADISRSDLDQLQSQIDTLRSDVGGVGANINRNGNAYERIAYLDNQLSQTTTNRVDDLETIIDTGGASQLVTATTANRYVNTFQGSERSTLPNTQVTTSIHNEQPITIRESLIDLDVATSRNRHAILGRPGGVVKLQHTVVGTGFEANRTYPATGGATNGSGFRLRVQKVDDEGKITEYVVADAGTEYAKDDTITVGKSTFLVESTVQDSLRTTDALENLECKVIENGTDMRNALRALDDELSFIRQAVGFNAASTTDMGTFDPLTQRFLPDNVNLRTALQTMASGLDNPTVSSIEVNGLAVLDGEIRVETDDPILLKTSKTSSDAIVLDGNTIVRNGSQTLSGTTLRSDTTESTTVASTGPVHIQSTGSGAKQIRLTAANSTIELEAPAHLTSTMGVDGLATLGAGLTLTGTLGVTGAATVDAQDNQIHLKSTSTAENAVFLEGNTKVQSGTSVFEVDASRTEAQWA